MMISLQVVFQANPHYQLAKKTVSQCERTLATELRAKGFTTGIWQAWPLGRQDQFTGEFRAQTIDRDTKPGTALLKTIVRARDKAHVVLLEPPSTAAIPIEGILQQLQGNDNPDELVAMRDYPGKITRVFHYGVLIQIAGRQQSHLCHYTELRTESVFAHGGLSDEQKVNAIKAAGFTVGKEVRCKALELSKDHRGKWKFSIKAATEAPGDGVEAFLLQIDAEGKLSTRGWFDDPDRVELYCEAIVGLYLERVKLGYIPVSECSEGVRVEFDRHYRTKWGARVFSFKAPGHLTRDAVTKHQLLEPFVASEGEDTLGYIPTAWAFRNVGMDPLEGISDPKRVNPDESGIDLDLAEQFSEKSNRIRAIEAELQQAGMLDLAKERDEHKRWMLRNPAAHKQFEASQELAARLERLKQ